MTLPAKNLLRREKYKYYQEYLIELVIVDRIFFTIISSKLTKNQRFATFKVFRKKIRHNLIRFHLTIDFNFQINYGLKEQPFPELFQFQQEKIFVKPIRTKKYFYHNQFRFSIA